MTTETLEPVELSIVVPMLNESAVLERFFARLVPLLEGVTERHQLLCVVDGVSTERFHPLEAPRARHRRRRPTGVRRAVVLCAVADRPRGLAGRRRVLRPGGALRLFEHVRSDRRWVARLQQVGTPAWSFVAGGCHLNRDTVAAVVAAGFEVDREEAARVPAVPMKHVVIFARRPAA